MANVRTMKGIYAMIAVLLVVATMSGCIDNVIEARTSRRAPFTKTRILKQRSPNLKRCRT
jgi:hypothetical protein